MARQLVALPFLLLAVGCGGSESTPALVKHLDDPDSAVRLNAVKLLGRRSGDAGVVVPALAERLQRDDDLYVRRDSANALGGFGSAARPAG